MTAAAINPAAAHSARLAALIRAAINGAGGRLPFDQYMELALYAPGLGYYVAGAEKLGPAGDFVTAPELSPLFGRCLAAQARQMLMALRGGDLLELGAGTGALAAELLAALAADGPLPGRYLILEPSPDLAARQRATLAARVPALADRVVWLQALPTDFRGLMLANEVVDAMPVHRFVTGADGRVLEVFVTAAADGFAEVTGPVASPGLAAAVAALHADGLAVAPGYATEVNLRAGPWVAALAQSLAAGLALIIDYGYPRREYYLPERASGTLVCHGRHQVSLDPLVTPGLLDITAHVDFSALAAAGQGAGLTLAGYTTQAQFLIGCGIDRLLAAAAGEDPFALAQLAAGAKQLLLPGQMGERFQVLGLARDLPDAGALIGFTGRDLRHRL